MDTNNNKNDRQNETVLDNDNNNKTDRQKETVIDTDNNKTDRDRRRQP